MPYLNICWLLVDDLAGGVPDIDYDSPVLVCVVAHGDRVIGVPCDGHASAHSPRLIFLDFHHFLRKHNTHISVMQSC